MPNETYLYKWIVPDAVAPTENDPSCLTWMYYSHVDSTKDTHSGKWQSLLWQYCYMKSYSSWSILKTIGIVYPTVQQNTRCYTGALQRKFSPIAFWRSDHGSLSKFQPHDFSTSLVVSRLLLLCLSLFHFVYRKIESLRPSSTSSSPLLPGPHSTYKNQQV